MVLPVGCCLGVVDDHVVGSLEVSSKDDVGSAVVADQEGMWRCLAILHLRGDVMDVGAWCQT